MSLLDKLKALDERTLPLNHVLTSGKYKGKGKTIQYVINTDCKYINWLIENRFIKLNKEAMEHFERMNLIENYNDYEDNDDCYDPYFN